MTIEQIRDKLEKLREAAGDQKEYEFSARHFDNYVQQNKQDAETAGSACCALMLEIESAFECLIDGLNLYRAAVPAYTLPSLEKQQKAVFTWEREHGKEFK